MNVVYHGNCFDGAFSVQTMYIFFNLFQRYSILENFTQWIVEYIKKYPKILFHNKDFGPKNKILEFFKQIPEILDQSFYLSDKINNYHSVLPSKFTLDFVDYIKLRSKQSKKEVIFLLDCYGEKLKCIQRLSELFGMVIIIDHHTSAKQTLKQIQAKNVYYYFDEEKCAFQLVIDFLSSYFQFDQVCPKSTFSYLKSFSSYISKNDLKLNENLLSKQFMLGIYWFQINTMDNPLLFKRLSNLSLDFILQKGKNLYPQFIQEISKALKLTLILNIQIESIKIRALGMKVKQFNLVSDLGKVLSYYAVKNNFSNVVVFFREEYNKKEHKISFRSSREGQDPLALRLASQLGGGGHLLAASCKIQNKKFKRIFKIAQYLKCEIKNFQEIIMK